MKRRGKGFAGLNRLLAAIPIFVISFCLMILCACGKNRTLPEYQTIKFQPPTELLSDIQLPDRSNMKTVGDMIRIIISDEEVIRYKNADLKALREYVAKFQDVEDAK